MTARFIPIRSRLCAALLALAAALTLAGCARPLTLTVLHTNDVHSRLTPADNLGRICTEDKEADCFGGLPRQAALADSERAASDAVLLLDAGDQFTGSLYFTRFQGRAAAALMNAAGYDAMAPGNHEFDKGDAVLAAFIRAADFPLLACNVDASTESPLHGLIQPHLVLTRAGRRIGLTGVLTPETGFLSSPGPGVSFADPAASLAREAAALREMGVDIVIVLSHLGYAQDLDLAGRVDGLDLIVGGHSHTVLGSGDDAAGPYPTVATSPSGQPVLVVQDGQWGRAMGRIRIDFDSRGVARSWDGAPVLLDGSAPSDSTVAALARPYRAELAAYQHEVVGRLPRALPLDKQTCRFGQCPLGDLVADAALAAARPAGARAALINSGGIRAGLPAGDVTLGDVLTALPFGNELSVADLPGKVLLLLLEHGLSRADGHFDSGTGRFLQVAGLRFSWSPARPAGARVSRAEIATDTGWEPVRPDGVYRVALIDYLLHGGDDFAMLKPYAPGAYTTSRSTADALAAALAQGQDAPEPGVRIRREP